MISKFHYITQGVTPEQHLEYTKTACDNGATWIQLRLKNLEESSVLETAKRARMITKTYNVKLIINDYYEIARLVDADGVHVGQSDTCPLKVRAKLGAGVIIGGTANTFEECKSLLAKQVDYIGLGPFRNTKTKSNLAPVLGLTGYQKILTQLNTKIPVIGIGGITQKDVQNLLETGLHGVAVSGEITRDFTKIQEWKRVLNMEFTSRF